jgi:hypothetical protein
MATTMAEVLWTPFGLRGWFEQRCDANSLSRSDSKFRIIASRVLPLGGPGGLKAHAHMEQPQPRKRGWSIHTSSRGMGALILRILHKSIGNRVIYGGFQRREEWVVLHGSCRGFCRAPEVLGKASLRVQWSSLLPKLMILRLHH